MQLNIPNLPSISVLPRLAQCDQFIGFIAVYRVCMAVASFFLLMSLVMICVWSSKDPRSYVQNGFWVFKWLFVIGLVVAFFFIPDGSNLYFSRGRWYNYLFRLINTFLLSLYSVVILGTYRIYFFYCDSNSHTCGFCPRLGWKLVCIYRYNISPCAILWCVVVVTEP